jgi:hypothetical protein
MRSEKAGLLEYADQKEKNAPPQDVGGDAGTGKLKEIFNHRRNYGGI